MEEKSFTYIFYDILDKVLVLSENPSQFAEYLSQQIRELIGAKTIVIAIKSETDEAKIFSVFPTRRKEWASQKAMLRLAEISFCYDNIQYLNKETTDSETLNILNEIEIENAIAIPLVTANKMVGTILLVDIMDLYGINAIIDLLTRLSGVFALIIKNSLLYSNLENVISARTIELQKRNFELLEREQQLKTANEEYEALNEELSENLTKITEINSQLAKSKTKAEESEKKYRILYNNTPVMLQSADLMGNITSINDYWIQSFGYTLDEVIGTKSSSYLTDESKKIYTSKITEFIKNGEINNIEAQAIKKNGEIVDLLISSKIFYDSDGKPIQTMTNLVDISLKKQAEKQQEKLNQLLLATKEHAENIAKKLVETEKQLKLKLDFILSPDNSLEIISLTEIIDLELLQKIQDNFTAATGVSSIITDTDGKPTTQPSNFSKICTLIRETEKGRQNCFYSDKLIGIKAAELKRPTYEKCHSCGFIDAGAPIIVASKQLAVWMIGQSNVGEVDEEKIYKYAVEIGANPETMVSEYQKMKNMSIEQFEKVTKFLWIMAQEISSLAYNNLLLAKNIEEQKMHETELLRAKEKAEESDRLKTAFLQNISHEIRTPMNAIVGFSGMLNRPELSEEKWDSFVNIIQNSSQQLLNIVTDILTISSLETKLEKAHIDKVCINYIIDDLYSIFYNKAQEKKNRFIAKKELNDNESEVYTDKTKLTQILTNLLSNAIKFTHTGYIEFGYSVVEASRGVFLQTEIQFFVKDNGLGIQPELHEKIFERFRQADKSIQTNYGGSGLGLSISKGFIELLGGKIWVESEMGKGSTFLFTIPFRPANSNEIGLNKKKKEVNQGIILIAEDDDYNFLFIQEILNDLDVEIIHAKNGQETIDICKANPNICLILMDIKMPIIDGHTAAVTIKKDKPNLPIIAQTAYTLEHEIDFYKGIFNDYITKPIDKEILKQKVLKYLNIAVK